MLSFYLAGGMFLLLKLVVAIAAVIPTEVDPQISQILDCEWGPCRGFLIDDRPLQLSNKCEIIGPDDALRLGVFAFFFFDSPEVVTSTDHDEKT